MSETTHYWQGGRKLPLQQSEKQITVQVDTAEEVHSAARAVGVPVARTKPLGANLVIAEVEGDRDDAMAKLRRSHVVHHVYHPPSQPSSDVLITDTFFIKFKPNTTAETIRRYLESEHLLVERDLGENLLLVKVTDATGRNPIRTANAAAERADVEYAEPNLVRSLKRFSFIPADSYFAKQWHLHSPRSAHELVKGAGVFCPEAWEITLGTRDVVIAVADDGIDLTHPDFAGPGKIVGRMNFRPRGSGIVIDDDASPRSRDYHGTPCAGVAVAEINGRGTVGVAPGCSLLAVRFPLTTFQDGHFIRMFERISPLADVVSCSWGYGPADAPMSSPLKTKIAQLASKGGRRGTGLVFCVAAGNYNCPVKDLHNTRTYQYVDDAGLQTYSGPIDRWIATHPDVLTVSACTSLKTRAAYSSWGREVDVCAPSSNGDDLGALAVPGLGIVTTDNEDDGSGFTASSRYTRDFGGTSSATPTVAGVCALVISRNPELTAKQVRDIVRSTADKDLVIHSDNPVNSKGDFVGDVSSWFGHGKVNAARAVRAAIPEGHAPRVFAQTRSPNAILPDDGTAIVDRIAADSAGEIRDIRVVLEVEHPHVGDLRVDLVTPAQTVVNLHNHGEGSKSGLCRTYEAADHPPLRALLGHSIQGTWALQVRDRWNMDAGRLKTWKLILKY